MQKNAFLGTQTSKTLLATNLILLVVYFYIICFWFTVESYLAFGLLMLGQVYFFWQGITYLHTVYNTKITLKRLPSQFQPTVDIFVTVCGEPVTLVRQTILAAKKIRYPHKNIFILNDGLVARKDNWQEIEKLALQTGVTCFTRTVPGGAKAGNINFALRHTTSPFFLILDADHVPKSTILSYLLAPFIDERVGFVQSPQYYKNFAVNRLTRSAWEQQQLFFGTISCGKHRLNATTLSGTNMVIRRSAIEAVGGMREDNIAEDFLTGMMMHAAGWRSYYVPIILAEGLSPEDFLTYYKQQLRWAKGSLELLFKFNPFFNAGLSWSQRISYVSSATYYLQGLVIVANALLPILFLFTGLAPFTTDTLVLVAVFLPFIFVTVFNLQFSSNYTYTYRALALSLASFWIHLVALYETVVGRERGFDVSSKTQIAGNFPLLVLPHLLYFALYVSGIAYALFTEGATPSVVTNVTWATFYVIIFGSIVKIAIPHPAHYLSAVGQSVVRLFRLKPQPNQS